MFASVDLKEKELKKLWVEFGKIDKDGGRTVSECACRVEPTDSVGAGPVVVGMHANLRLRQRRRSTKTVEVE